jgi:TonB family protein
MNLQFVALFLACCLSVSAAAAQDVEQSLKQQFEGKILILRHSLQGNSQEYDSEGNVRKDGEEGPWTLYGRIKVDEVRLSADKLLLTGHRVDYKLDPSAQQLAPFPNKIRTKVEIALKQPLKDSTEAGSVLGHVFAFTKKDVIDSAPEFWRGYLDKHIPPRPPEEKAVAPADQPEKRPELLARGAKAPEHDATRPFSIGRGGVPPPTPLFTPEPEFPARASSEHYEGIVVLTVLVDASGKVQNIRLVRPAGMGMEEEAVATVSKWRFKPAQREGEPVAVEMNIEVAFNKY